MKKMIVLLLCLALALPCAAAAEETAPGITANGVVESQNVYEITAPYSGVLMPFDVESGDRVEAGELLFTLDTVKVYAPAAGTVQAVFAEEGDLCEDAISLYGMIACIEKSLPQTIQASTYGAYNDEENRLIHVGETVYFQQSNDKDNEGEGRVTYVSGSDYTVEMTKGDVENGHSVKLYRDEKMGTKTCIGTGKVERAADVTVAGSGRVLRCAVKEGQRVAKGQLLFELAAQDAEAGANAEVDAPETGALELNQTYGGQQVYKGMVLAKVHGLEAMNVVAEVDEMDLDRVHVGDSLTIVFDRYPSEQVSGTVTQISRIGVPKQNATYYDVTIAYASSLETLPGMNATVWLPAQQ